MIMYRRCVTRPVRQRNCTRYIEWQIDRLGWYVLMSRQPGTWARCSVRLDASAPAAACVHTFPDARASIWRATRRVVGRSR